jgi:hypothetical protein
LIVEAGVKNDQSLLRVLSIAKECIQNKQNKTKQNNTLNLLILILLGTKPSSNTSQVCNERCRLNA